MASSISAGTTSSTALVATADTTGALELKTNNGTVAVTIDTSQRTAFVAGTAAAPAITTTGDTNTGIFFPAADTIAFSEGGAEAMRIDTNGNVGIGTTSPAYKLEVRSTMAVLDGSANIGFWANGTSYTQVWQTLQSVNDFIIQTAASKYMSFGTNSTERMRIDTSGNVGIGGSPVSALYVARSAAQAATNTLAFTITRPGTADSFESYWSDNYSPNGAAATLKLGSISATSRSINASGTINASGSDYAEYMTKLNDFTVAKGDVVGIDGSGKLTNVFADAVSFVVKSTAPSFVGGDVWGTDNSLGLSNPTQPTQRTATEEVEAETDEDFAIRQATYKTEKAVFEAALEAARQLVDRVAFAGQVPVNVMGATPGQYIIPVSDNGAIKGQAVSNPTFEQYQSSVGKVIAVEADGRARIIVKVA